MAILQYSDGVIYVKVSLWYFYKGVKTFANEKILPLKTPQKSYEECLFSSRV